MKKLYIIIVFLLLSLSISHAQEICTLNTNIAWQQVSSGIAAAPANIQFQ